jgi:uncharacterized protein YkwD
MLLRVLSGASLLALAAIAVAASGPPRAEAFTNCDVGDLALDQEEAAFLRIINDYRAQYGLRPLTVSQNLNRSAAWMANDMATRNYFSHMDSVGRMSQTRIAQCGASGSSGENLGAGTYIITAAQAFELWRTSPSHNSNMLLAGYRQIGIARVTQPGSYYTNYWVTTFDVYDDGTQPASGGGSYAGPTLIDPTPGSQIFSHAYVFRWQSVPGVYEYWVDVGSCPSCNDLYSSSAGMANGAMVLNLPTDGRPLYVRLSIRTSRGWGFEDYSFSAANSPYS